VFPAFPTGCMGCREARATWFGVKIMQPAAARNIPKQTYPQSAKNPEVYPVIGLKSSRDLNYQVFAALEN
jgi:hypothetical protein